jgi:hypothetical protein
LQIVLHRPAVGRDDEPLPVKELTSEARKAIESVLPRGRGG